MESDGRWLTFKGTGTYTAQPLGYDWRVRLRVMFGLWFLAKDGYDEEDGWGGAWVYGIKSMGERRGPDVRAMQAVRNLAELVWVPDLADQRARSALVRRGRVGLRDRLSVGHAAGQRALRGR